MQIYETMHQLTFRHREMDHFPLSSCYASQTRTEPHFSAVREPVCKTQISNKGYHEFKMRAKMIKKLQKFPNFT